MSDSDKTGNPRLWLAVTVGIVIVVLIGWFVRQLQLDNVEELLTQARSALAVGNDREAEILARRCQKAAPKSAAAFRITGEALAHQGKYDAAVTCLDSMPDDGSADYKDGLVFASEIWLSQLYQMSEAEVRLRRVLKRDAGHTAANLAMYSLLASSARRREAVPYILELIKKGHSTYGQLVTLGSEDRLYKPPALLEQCYRANPKQSGVLLAMAQAAINKGNNNHAHELLKQSIEIDPGLLAAQSRMGSVLLQESSDSEFLDWHRQLPSAANNDADIWIVRGKWSQQLGDSQPTIRCFWEAARLDPNSRTAMSQLAAHLTAAGDHERAGIFLQRSRQLQVLKHQEAELSLGTPSLALLRQVAETMESLGRVWEAFGWCRVALERNHDLEWAQSQSRRLRDILATDPPLTLAAANPAVKCDLSDFPLPQWNRKATATVRTIASDSVSFSDMAVNAGLTFTYFNSPSTTKTGRKMYEFTGGGAAVLDYDNDGWPDIYLTQGCTWPRLKDNSEHTDRLFRNCGDGTFEDVTHLAGLVENSFSQGATVGDFNNDGFADLFVGNLGRNRLYRNNGDGTFTDITDSADIDGDSWTTSCLMCDLNGDSLPDLYAVNYLEGDDVYRRICKGGKGQPRLCKPSHFEAAQDQVYLNLGNGRFEEIAAKAGFAVANGKGLGIVAADFDGSGKLSVFVANDAVPNFHFRNQTKTRGEFPIFSEQAYSSGLALNGDGHAEGCMGIAIGDGNDDQRLDLFVTNFFSESNTLYSQSAGGLFSDSTARSGLAKSSLPMLGFGTQFIDADLDGHLDLILTNGHVDDLRAYGGQFQMPPQFFRNTRKGRFHEQSRKTLGPYFEGKYLGRGLARLDWNRDGREDVVISHLDAPAALLTNTTESAKHFIAIKLRGTISDRDAIGTSVIVKTAKKTILRQLTAGDGYHSSNQRILVFGLGDESRIEQLQIHWPSGLYETYDNLTVDQEITFIEGRVETANAN